MKRREKDVMKLLVSDFDVQLTKEERTEHLIVKMKGPQDSSYEGVSHDGNNNDIGSLDSEGGIARLVPI